MKPINVVPDGSLLAIAVAAASLALPPTGSCAVIPSWWTSSGKVVPEVELEVWSSVAVAVTVAKLYAAMQHPLTFANVITTSASSATDKLTKNAHGLLTGDGPIRLTTVAGLPAPLAVATDYWVIATDGNTFKLATSLSNALLGIGIDLTTNGTDATVVDTASSQTVRWHASTLLGLAGDGAIALSSTVGYRVRLPHNPRTVAYGLVATLDTGTASASIVPITEG